MDLFLSIPEENQHFYMNDTAIGIERFKIYTKPSGTVKLLLPNNCTDAFKIMSINYVDPNAFSAFFPNAIMIYDRLTSENDLPETFFKNAKNNSIVYFLNNQFWEIPTLPNYPWGSEHTYKVIKQIMDRICSMKFYAKV